MKKMSLLLCFITFFFTLAYLGHRYVLRNNWIRSISIRPDRKYFPYGSRSSTNLWSLPHREMQEGEVTRDQLDTSGAAFELVVQKGHLKKITSIAFSPDGHYLASGSWDGTVKIWRITDGILVKSLKLDSKDIDTFVAFSPDCLHMAASDAEEIKIWRVSNGMLVRTLRGHSDTIDCICFSANGDYMASGSEDGIVRLWRMSDGTLINMLPADHEIRSVAFSPDSQYLASASKKIKLWQISDGKLLKTFDDSVNVSCLQFSPDGRLLVASDGTRIKMWDSLNYRLVRTFEGSSSHSIRWISFTPDGKYLAGGFSDRKIRLWQSQDGKLLKTINARSSGFLTSMSISPDGRYLAASFWNYDTFYKFEYIEHNVTLYKIPACRRIKTLRGHSRLVASVAFTSDSKFLISRDNTLGKDNTLRLWRVLDGS